MKYVEHEPSLPPTSLCSKTCLQGGSGGQKCLAFGGSGRGVGLWLWGFVLVYGLGV